MYPRPELIWLAPRPSEVAIPKMVAMIAITSRETRPQTRAVRLPEKNELILKGLFLLNVKYAKQSPTTAPQCRYVKFMARLARSANSASTGCITSELKCKMGSATP